MWHLGSGDCGDNWGCEWPCWYQVMDMREFMVGLRKREGEILKFCNALGLIIGYTVFRIEEWKTEDNLRICGNKEYARSLSFRMVKRLKVIPGVGIYV